MWRPNPDGPQGPMQISQKAALDVGGGDRFDVARNRAIGRAYLSLLYRRYGNWADAISAYNWGMGNVDGWIRGGRPAETVVPGVITYLRRVLRDSGLCSFKGIAQYCEARAFDAGRQPCRSALAAISSTATFTDGSSNRGWSCSVFSNSTASRGNNLVLPGLERSGNPLPILANSGRPLPDFEQSGQPLARPSRAGRHL